MGLFPQWSKQEQKEFDEKMAHQDKVIANSDFTNLTGDFYQLQNWFRDKYGYIPAFEKDGKVYAYWQVLGILDLEEDNHTWPDLANYDEWEAKRKELLEKSGRPTWLIIDRD